MGKAGKALKQVLKTYGISQNRLAITMNVNRSTVNNWFNETRDPSAEALSEIIIALEKLDAQAANAFLRNYLGRMPPS